MVVARRPSLLNGGTQHYSYKDNQSSQQIQKTIQALRLKTQEDLAKHRDLIASLEEEIEVKQIRIDEIRKELQQINQEAENNDNDQHDNSPHSAPVRFTAQRRWSLAAGIAAVTKPLFDEPCSTVTQTQTKHQSQHLTTNQGDTIEMLKDTSSINYGRRSSLLGFKSNSAEDLLGASSKKIDFGYTGLAMNITSAMMGAPPNKTPTMEHEEQMMQKLHTLQEENKKIIHHHQTNLEFKHEQVKALHLASDAQTKTIIGLQQKLSKIDLLKDSPSKNDTRLQTNKHLDEEKLAARRHYLDERIHFLTGEIRRTKKINSMTHQDRNISIQEMKAAIVESEKRISSAKLMFHNNKEILTAQIEENLRTWNVTMTQITLMRRVSDKQTKRLAKKIHKGNSSQQDLQEVLDRATRALNEEIEMRQNDHVPAVSLVQQCVQEMDTLVDTMVVVCKKFTQDISGLQTLSLSEDLADAIIVTLEKMENSVDAVKEAIESAIDLLEDSHHVYDKDQDLLAPEVKEEFEREQKQVAEEEKTWDETTDTTSATSSTAPRIGSNTECSVLQAKIKQLDHKIKEAKQDLKDAKDEYHGKKSNVDGQLSGLREQYKDGKADWESKDKQIEDSVAEIDRLKEREQLLRAIIEKSAKRNTRENGRQRDS